MAGYVGAVIAIVILFGIMNYLPMNLQTKGKVYMIVTSALVALAAYASQITLSWWQSILVLVLLAFLMAVLLNRRLQQYVIAEDEAYIATEETTEEKEEHIEIPPPHEDTAQENDVLVQDQPTEIQVADLEPTTPRPEQEPTEWEESLKEMEDKPSNIEDNDDPLSEIDPAEIIENREQDDSSIVKQVEDENSEPHIEIDSELAPLTPEEELLASRNELQPVEEDEEEQDDEDIQMDRGALLEEFENTETTQPADPSDEEVNLWDEDVLDTLVNETTGEVPPHEGTSEESGAANDSLERMEDRLEDLESFEGMEDQLEEADWLEGVEEQLEDADVIEEAERIEEIDPGSNETGMGEKFSSEEKTQLQTQMLHTLVEEVMVQSEWMEPDAYSTYIKEFLHPSLPQQDYYTFASLLLQHLIKQEKYEEIREWIPTLQARFEGYDVIQEELTYIDNLAKGNL